jgi:DeoR family fructose operon transcriptional repressor
MSEASHRGLAAERQAQLASHISASGGVRVDELCAHFAVSAATVRRDLEVLERAGRIRRVHGGAIPVERGRLTEPQFDAKTGLALGAKRAIAAAAASHIATGDTIYLDGGSTILELARLLVGRDDITVVTNSMRAASELSGRGPRLVVIGGELRRRSQTIVGPLTRATLQSLHLDRAFMGTMGLTLDEGLSTTDHNEAFTKELVMARSREVLLLADSSKIGEVSFAHSGDVEQVDVLITDGGVDGEFAGALRERGVAVELVDVDQEKE